MFEVFYCNKWKTKRVVKKKKKAIWYKVQNKNSLLYNRDCFFFFFFFFLASPAASRNSPGQESNPCHNSNPSCCSDNTRSLTCCITRELWDCIIFVLIDIARIAFPSGSAWFHFYWLYLHQCLTLSDFSTFAKINIEKLYLDLHFSGYFVKLNIIS